MGSSGAISEIIEAGEENLACNFNRLNPLRVKLRADDGKSHGYPVEDNLSRLIDAIDLRTSPRLGPYRQASRDLQQKDTSKKPVRVGIMQASGIGISESVTLKQALRRVCISQASEMAALKRSSKPIGFTGMSEVGTIKRLYASVMVESSRSNLSPEEERKNFVEISLVPEKVSKNVARNVEVACKNVASSPHVAVSAEKNVKKTRIRDVIAPASKKNGSHLSAAAENGIRGKTKSSTSVSSPRVVAESTKPSVSPQTIKPVLRNGTSSRNNGKQEPVSTPTISRTNKVNEVAAVPSKSKLGDNKSSSHSSNRANPDSAVDLKSKDGGARTPISSQNSSTVGKTVGAKVNKNSRSREKGEFSQSSKSSLGDYSSSTSISDESNQSGSNSNGSRPHMSKDVRWEAIRHVVVEQGNLGLKNFKLLRRLGCGDIGTVYLAELIGTGCLFALKVMDIEFLLSRKKMPRAQTEREILQILDHPFLPTLYAHFTTDNLSFLVMEYCPGGDLHVLRQKQPGRNFSEAAARFYVAEVLLALEYLHMLGVVYRDLKPENILVREDGHIMLTDFDLSLRCTVSPTLLSSSLLGTEEPAKKLSGPCAESSCIEPLCLQPSWVNVSCFTPRLLSSSTTLKTRKIKSDLASQVSPLPQLVVEPTDARSNSFVGTHEYLAPEIIRGDGHGSAVDWWTFGIFLYELLFGRTPFKGAGNEETLANAVSQSLKFPESPAASFHAKDLIKGLLVKEPECRLGSSRGAAEIKQHPFFEGLNWALIRCAAPPEVPRSYDLCIVDGVGKRKEGGKCLDFTSNGENVEFELF